MKNIKERFFIPNYEVIHGDKDIYQIVYEHTKTKLNWFHRRGVAAQAWKIAERYPERYMNHTLVLDYEVTWKKWLPKSTFRTRMTPLSDVDHI